MGIMMARRYSIKSRPKSWVVRNKDGTFKDWHAKSRSVPLDRAKTSKNKVKAGYGHQGDQKTRENPFKKSSVTSKTPTPFGASGVGLNLKKMKKILGK